MPESRLIAPSQPRAAEQADSGAPPRGTRPRVLVIASDLPWPLDSGYRIRAYENLRALVGLAEVSVVCFSEDPEPAKRLAEAEAALPDVSFRGIVPLRIHIKDDPVLLAKAAASGLLTGRPYKVAKFASAEMRRFVRELVSANEYDALHVELATMMYAESVAAGQRTRRVPIVLDEYNVEWQLLSDHGRRGAMGPLGAAVGLEARRTRSYEAAACRRADLVIAISDDDAADLKELSNGTANVRVVPAVAAKSSAPVKPADDPQRETVLFVGQMSWLPNEEAVRWFCENVLPVLREDHPDLRFEIVGGGASPELGRSIRAAGGEPLGYVADLSAVYGRAAVFVAPFLTGGGVRIKLLEAMREHVPIVSTSAGARGLTALAGRQILVADTPADFSEAVGGLLADPDLRRDISRSAAYYLRANHSRFQAAESLRSAYESVGLGCPRRARTETATETTLAAVGQS